ncbi:MAG: membrane protein insertase YidC [Deltaproteobacteria bacterium]|jgi:YidC/Oxa1 family membrane protein insertase|nr:membrane protein insertase YidC [Deltaproteobacteria bacterium]
MEKRVVVTMVVMVAFFVLVNVLYPVLFPPPPVPQTGSAVSESEFAGSTSTATDDYAGGESTGTLSSGQATEPLEPLGQVEASVQAARDIFVETPEYEAVFTERGARLKSLTLKGYGATRVAGQATGQPQQMVGGSGDPGADMPLSLRIYVNDYDFLDLSTLTFTADRESLKVGEGSSGRLVFVGETARGLRLERVFTFEAGGYYINQTVTARNMSDVSAYGGRLGMTLNVSPFAGRPGRYDSVAGFINGKLFTATAAKAQGEINDLPSLAYPDWFGYMSQYFLAAIVLSNQSNPALTEDWAALRLQALERAQNSAQLVASWPLRLNPGADAVYDFSVYYGPKEVGSLDAAGHNLGKSVDLGWFGFLAKPLAWLLRMFYGLVGNYGLAIIIVTFLIKLALAPLTAKSYKSMKQMQKLQPRMLEIREKYKDDREALNKATMQLYRTYKVNPLGGCLPMLLQIPFFIAFYRVLDYALELRGAPFILWIKDLSAPDRLFDFGVTIPFLEPPTGIPVMTLLMAGSMIWQQKMTPAMGDPMQAKMMMMMPIVFSVILLNMPAGLVLYWLVNNILSIIQQKLINRSQGETKASAPARKAK